MITKLYNIGQGWFKRLFIPINNNEIKRLNICLECTSKIKLGPEWICKECGCPINSKVRADKEKCLLNKW